jgi:hypothetical protein
MTDEECLSRWEVRFSCSFDTINSHAPETLQDLRRHVEAQSAQAFVTSFLSRCLRANSEHRQVDITSIPNLDVSSILPRYQLARTRILLFDFEGTLWQRNTSKASLSQPFTPPEEPLRILNKLAEDGNVIWLLSGLPVKGVMEKVAELAPGIGIMYVTTVNARNQNFLLMIMVLSAENGCFIKTLPAPNSPSSWVNMVSNLNLTWKSICLEILYYVC